MTTYLRPVEKVRRNILEARSGAGGATPTDTCPDGECKDGDLARCIREMYGWIQPIPQFMIETQMRLLELESMLGSYSTGEMRELIGRARLLERAAMDRVIGGYMANLAEGLEDFRKDLVDNGVQESLLSNYDYLVRERAGIEAVPTDAIGKRFDEQTMTLIGTVPTTDESQAGTVAEQLDDAYYIVTGLKNMMAKKIEVKVYSEVE